MNGNKLIERKGNQMLMNGFVLPHSAICDQLRSETGLSHDYTTLDALQNPVYNKGGHYAGSSDTQGRVFQGSLEAMIDRLGIPSMYSISPC